MLCTVCARGGSKGVPLKNVRLLLGRPLIQHTIGQARATGLFDAMVVSTDAEDIAAAARAAGAIVPFMRPAHLATDRAPKIPVIRHALVASEEHLGKRFDVVVDLDATAPLRRPDDVVACVALLEDRRAPNVFSVTPSRHSPYFNVVEERDGEVRLVRESAAGVAGRQDAPPTFDMNASIYVWRREILLSKDSLFLPGTAMYVMPPERSVDIDSELDWRIVEYLMGSAGDTAC